MAIINYDQISFEPSKTVTAGLSPSLGILNPDEPAPESTYAYVGYEKMNGAQERWNFPIGGPLYSTYEPGIEIKPIMHYESAVGKYNQAVRYEKFRRVGDTSVWHWIYAIKKDAHITSDSNYIPKIYTEENPYPIEYRPGTDQPLGTYTLPNRKSHVYQFRGSVTFVNPENDPDKQDIMDYGLEYDDKKRNGPAAISAAEILSWKERDPTSHVAHNIAESDASPQTPTHPIHPFTRMFADRAHNAIVTSYNRTKIPIADIEHRKAFRHVFITRPECYLMASGDRPSYQVLNDDDMATCWMRFPHVIRSLSPVYVTSSNFAPKYANWNWLLCNRVQGLSTGNNSLELVDSGVKAVRGATVTMGKNMKSNLGGTLQLSFRDTKYMDVYEMIRIWMLYIHKRRMGTFYPSYNGYQQNNGFYPDGVSVKLPGGYSTLHPYDRALDYTASIYDIVTDETGQRILYWCKYYGVFPIDLSNSMLSNDNNAPLISEAKLTTTFQYQYKQENIFKNLVEFNYNAGICDGVGNMRADVSTTLRKSIPFLYRENGVGGTSETNPAIQNYIGAASMFTGSPYIVTEFDGAYDPWDWKSDMRSKMVRAHLCFVPIFYGDPSLNETMNLGISNEIIPDRETREVMVLQSGL